MYLTESLSHSQQWIAFPKAFLACLGLKQKVLLREGGDGMKPRRVSVAPDRVSLILKRRLHISTVDCTVPATTYFIDAQKAS